MEPISWRKLEEALADMSKSLWRHYKECKDRGFSRRQAFELTKILLTITLQSTLLNSALRQKDGEG